MDKKKQAVEGKPKSNILNKIVKWFWVLFITGIATVVLLFVMIAKGHIGYMPPIEDLQNPINKYASQVISSDAKLLGTYSLDKENRIYVNYQDLSPNLIKALIATEDIRYAEHSGIDFYALMRAVIKRGIFQQKNAGGASTISQQLAKLLYTERASSTKERLFQKPVEWVIAVQLEHYYTKEEIINLYLNKFDFLYNAIGIQSASWLYFGEKPKDLSIEQAATLIGMCKNPSYFNPVRFNKRSQERRNMVISLMAKHGFITREEMLEAQNKPLEVKFNRIDHKDGLAPHFRQYLRGVMMAKKPDKKDYRGWQMQKFHEDSLSWETNPLYGWCHKNKKSDGSSYNVYTDGLKIYTSIDTRMQQYAEDAVNEHIGGTLQVAFDREKRNSKTAPFSRHVSQDEVNSILRRSMQQTDRYRALKSANASDAEIEKAFNTPVDMTVFSWAGMKDTTMTPMDSIRYMKSFLRTGFMAMDSRTGAVKAYVGDINYNYFKYDMVSLGKRQIGSTVKPFLYSLAMESGFSPCDEVLHVEQTIVTETGSTWTPKTTTRQRIGEMVSLNWGLQNSDNWISAYLMKQLSPYAFARTLNTFGLLGPIDPVYSLSLGSCDASVSEMVTGYSAFSNKGIKAHPMYVTRIEDNYGNVIATFTPRTQEILGEEAAYKMLSMLRNVIDGGTGGRIRRNHKMTVPMGGKTGTTQNHSDGWFMCFTPTLVGGCWVGGEDRSIHFDRITEGQGAAMALPVVGIFMNKVYNDPALGYSQTESFTVPARYADPCHTRIDEVESTHIPTYSGMDEFFQ